MEGLKSLKNKKVWLSLILGGLTFFLLDMLLLEKVFFNIRKFKFGNLKNKQHIRIIQISDLHFKRSFNWKYRRLLKKIKKVCPDLLIITGDALDRTGHLNPLKKFLSHLPAEPVKAAILGNHDHASDVKISDLIETYREHKIDYLINESKIYRFNGFNLAVTGLDDFMEGADNLEKAFANVQGLENHIILAHNPKHIDRLKPFLHRLNHYKIKK